MSNYPIAKDSDLIGTYPALVKAGGGYVWDEVLEYRVWCHPCDADPNKVEGEDYYYAFNTYEEASEFSKKTPGAETPLALVLQLEYIDEPDPGKFIHVKEKRLTEWPVEFLSRPKRTEYTILNFFSPNAPKNRLDILRGIGVDPKL